VSAAVLRRAGPDVRAIRLGADRAQSARPLLGVVMPNSSGATVDEDGFAAPIATPRTRAD
jgi:hypothetical protein